MAPATTEIYTLSLHDALPILASDSTTPNYVFITPNLCHDMHDCSVSTGDRKSTRLNSSHRCISYAVFCLKKKINRHPNPARTPLTCAASSAQPSRSNSIVYAS